MSVWQVLVVVALLLLLAGTQDVSVHWRQLRKELQTHLQVHSAETTQGREAEFLRDCPPRRLPRTALLVAVAVGMLFWWLTS
jgi:hypothetical protein